MALPIDPAHVRAIAERLVACRSASPDVVAETRCARLLAEFLLDVPHGEWPTPDGRPVVWAHRPGRSRRSVVVLGHYDTVGVAEFESLGAPEDLAFDCAALRRRLIERAAEASDAFGPSALADLNLETRHAGTWMFGRGALDMKSGLAAGVAVLQALARAPAPPECGMLFVATPDEENDSAGMIAALRELRRVQDREEIQPVGVLNLDYSNEPAAYLGVMGKLEAACYVIGRPTHVSRPFDGLDAAQLAAAITARVTQSRDLVDAHDGHRGMPPVALRLRDLKPAYNVQTALEAWAEFNLLTFTRSVHDTLLILKAEVARALQALLKGRSELEAWIEPESFEPGLDVNPTTCVMTYPELVERAGGPIADDPLPSGMTGLDARAATLERLRELARRARLTGPAVIVLLVPLLSSRAPGEGALSRAARAALIAAWRVRAILLPADLGCLLRLVARGAVRRYRAALPPSGANTSCRGPMRVPWTWTS
jgi:arginine utilization protein RocB